MKSKKRRYMAEHESLEKLGVEVIDGPTAFTWGHKGLDR
jgi:hypothetical protein